MQIKVEKATPQRLKELKVENWSSWECPPKEFDWAYDSQEICYIKEGHAIVSGDGQKAEFKGGDIVTFPAGLKCRWKVIETIRKVYTFN